MRRALLIGVLAAAAIVAFAVGLRLTAESSDASPEGADLAHVRARLVDRYYVRVPERVLRQRTIQATIAALQDPYTEYLSPFAVSELRRQTQGSYTGIGVRLLPRA